MIQISQVLNEKRGCIYKNVWYYFFMNKKGLLVLTGNRDVNLSFKRYIKYVFGMDEGNIFYLTFDDNITPNIMESTDFWIIEGFKPNEPDNPTGWRTAKKCGKKVLVFFLSSPPLEIKERHFFTFLNNRLKKKIEEAMKSPKPAEKDFEEIEEKWEILKYIPDHHHHHEK